MFRFTLSWTFCWLVALLDVAFAFCNWETFAWWEGNPIAIWVAGVAGFPGVVAMRLMPMLAGCLFLARLAEPLRKRGTLVVTAVHVGLLLAYADYFFGTGVVSFAANFMQTLLE
jgi:hypothetical protein